MKRLMGPLAVAVVVSAAVSGCCTFSEKEVVVPLDTVPAAVQATITAHTFGGTVGKVEKETKKCGVVYEAEVKGPGQQSAEVKVGEDGKLLKYKTEKE